MTPETARMVRMLISAFVSGVIGMLGILVQAVTDTGSFKPASLTIAILTGITLMGKDIQSYLAQAPIKPPQMEVPVQPEGRPQP